MDAKGKLINVLLHAGRSTIGISMILNIHKCTVGYVITYISYIKMHKVSEKGLNIEEDCLKEISHL